MTLPNHSLLYIRPFQERRAIAHAHAHTHADCSRRAIHRTRRIVSDIIFYVGFKRTTSSDILSVTPRFFSKEKHKFVSSIQTCLDDFMKSKYNVIDLLILVIQLVYGSIS